MWLRVSGPLSKAHCEILVEMSYSQECASKIYAPVVNMWDVWVCGLTFPTARLKAASKFHCSYAGLAAGRPLREVGKVLIHRRVWPLFSKWLHIQNELPERRELHWPVLLPLESNLAVDGDGYKLKCSKCGLVLEHARKKAMLEARCKRTTATTALARIDEQIPKIEITDLVCRGGRVA